MIPLSPRLYLYAGVAAAFASVLLFASCEHKAASRLRLQNGQLLRSVAMLEDANESNVETIKTLHTANEKWRQTCKPAEIYTQLMEEKKAADERITNLLKQNIALRNKDRELPQCVALLKISLSQRCPNIAAGVLKLASDSEDGNGDSPSPGGETSPF